jgi:hypothetical protein
MLTNKHNLPEAFRNFEKRNPHTSDGADYTVTTLIDSPRIASLKDLHGDEIDEDVSDRIMAILGTAVHKILETGVGYGETPEQRFHTEVGGIKISGQVDLQTECSNGVLLSDYKTTSAFVVQKFPHGKPEHERQLNTYAYLARRNGVKISGLEVVAIIRDWSDGNARRSSEYPKNPVVRIPIRMWDDAEAEEYVIGRVALHRDYDGGNCTDEEMWVRPAKYAVHENKKATASSVKPSWSKRAKRLLDSRTAAEMYILDQSQPGRFRVEERPAEYVRCDNYCAVARWCEQNNRRIMNG